jgi:hypothetical protein
VMVLHDHQANPHVHLSVRVESRYGQRLNPRKADLRRWRETFAEKLRGWGVEAEATRRATRGGSRTFVEPLWRIKARGDGRLRVASTHQRPSRLSSESRGATGEAWLKIAEALARSGDSADRDLANRITKFVDSQALACARESERESNPQSMPAKVDVNRDVR